MKVLLDTCVVVDVLQKREPFYQNAMDIFLAISLREFFIHINVWFNQSLSLIRAILLSFL